MPSEVRLSFWTRLLDAVSPRQCPVCSRRLTVSEQGVCGSCLMHLPLTGFEQDVADNEMARLFWGRLPIERAAALFFYEPQADASSLVYSLKYHGRPELGRQLGLLMARRLQPAGFFDGIDYIVPVPLSRRRQWQRGYNQSREIARGISEATGLPIYNKVVRRTRFRGSQTHLNKWERQSNVEDVFRLTDAAAISGRHLLLVDDVVTTGATVTACGRALADAADVRLSVLSLAFTKP